MELGSPDPGRDHLRRTTMSSMNPPWEAGWPGRGPHRRHRRFGPGFGPAEAHIGPPPEPPDGPADEAGRGRGRGGPFRRRRPAASGPAFGPGRPAARLPRTRRAARPAHPARRRPQRRPRPGRGAAAARLRDHPGDRRAHRRGVAAQPGLDLPDGVAARGRGPGPHREGGGPPGHPPDRGGHPARRGAPRRARRGVGHRRAATSTTTRPHCGSSSPSCTPRPTR